MNYEKLLQHANLSMSATFLISLMAVFVAYGLPSLSMTILVVAHVSIMVLATVFKLSYVARIVAQRQLNLAIC